MVMRFMVTWASFFVRPWDTKRKATIESTVAFFSYKKTLKGKTFVTKVY